MAGILRRRGSKPEVVTLGQFIDSANESLDHANDPAASLATLLIIVC